MSREYIFDVIDADQMSRMTLSEKKEEIFLWWLFVCGCLYVVVCM